MKIPFTRIQSIFILIFIWCLSMIMLYEGFSFTNDIYGGFKFILIAFGIVGFMATPVLFVMTFDKEVKFRE